MLSLRLYTFKVAALCKVEPNLVNPFLREKRIKKRHKNSCYFDTVIEIKE